MIKAHAVYGSPGTGKTTEVLRRIECARSNGIAAEQIGFLSHTKAAAAEALERLSLHHAANVSTIHSLCFRLLNLTRDMVVGRKALQLFAAGCGLSVRGGQLDDNEQVEVGDDYLAIFNRAVATGQDMHTIFDKADTTGTWEQCRWFVDRYQSWKKKHGLLDYNDMLSQFIAAPVNSGIRALFIDEAQDLTPLQWQVIDRLLTFDVDEVHIAGDDDQAIFVWGGADPRGMVEFERKYGAERTVLPQSYRIPRSVHRLAHRVITKGAPGRVPKKYAARDEEGTVSECSDLYAINSWDYDGSTMILARHGARKREIERHLINECVPYTTVGGLPGLLQNRTARAIRTLHRLRKPDETVSANDVDALRREATPTAAVAINNRDFGKLASMPDSSAINIPNWMERYYDSVDVFETPTIKLMTIHSSKGREADHVVVDTSLTRRISNGMADDPASEARVFYVGVTRARHQLVIVHGANGYQL